MPKRYLLPIWMVALILLISGCANFQPGKGFDQVAGTVAERTGYQVQWNQNKADDQAVAEKVKAMLAEGLDHDRAVQIALLNNRRLQAVYEDLGVAQGNLVQAGLLRNPVFDGSIRFQHDGSIIDLTIVQSFLDIFLMPLRKQAAEAEFEAARHRVTGAVMDMTYDVSAAWSRLLANLRLKELQTTMVAASRASYDTGRRLRAAGNVTDLDLAIRQAEYEQDKLDLSSAERMVAEARERLNSLMGLWGRDIAWQTKDRLPYPPKQEMDLSDIERRAIEKSLDLAQARAEFEAAAKKLGIINVTSVIDDFEAGVTSERDVDGTWSVGPSVTVPIPVFNQGQGTKAAANAQIRQLWNRYTALAIDIRSAARAARFKVRQTRDRAEYVRNVILPLRRHILKETQLQYNAMQLGVFDLLEGKKEEILTQRQLTEELYDYWEARTALLHLLNGRLAGGSMGGR